MEKEELIYNGMKFPKSLNDKITAEANEDGVDRVSIVRKALYEHFKRKEHPEILVQQMMQVLRDNPAILAPVIKDEVQTQLRLILGEKH